MKNTIPLHLCIFLFSFCLLTEMVVAADLKLVPMPRELSMADAETVLTPDWKILKPDDTYNSDLLINEISHCLGWEPAITESATQTDCIILRKIKPEENEPELFIKQGYILRISPDHIIIEAPSETGVFYGVQTLRQIIRTSDKGRLPRLKIKDYPSLEWRGVSDDISRGQVSTVENFENIIRELAFYKKNLYQPYIEDMFTFDTDPNIGRTRGAITKEEMAQMLAVAKQNHIILNPVFECLGHQDRLLGLPENLKYAEYPEEPWSFSPVLTESLEFVKKLIDEMAEAAPSQFFHIGGDESWDVGKGTSKEMVEEFGKGKVHADYFTELHDYIKEKYDRQIMLYSDMLLRNPEAMEILPKDCIIVDWHYGVQDDYESVKTLKDAGFKYIMASPGLRNWSNFYPNYGTGLKNVAAFFDVARRENIMGGITSSWGDNGAENLRENNTLGYAYSAAALWETRSPDENEFLDRYTAVYYGISSPELAKVEQLLGWVDYLDTSYPGRIFHRPPRIRIVREEVMERMELLRKNTKKAIRIISRCKPRVKYGRDHLDTLDHVARRFLFMAERHQILDKTARRLQERNISDISRIQRNLIIRDLKRLRDDLLYLTAEFEHHWLENNKYPMLDFNIKRFQTQVSALQSFISQAERGGLTADIIPEITWFWYPEGNPRQKTEVGTRYFIREIDLAEPPVSAELTVWVDDKATVFMNGEEIAVTSFGDPPTRTKITEKLNAGKNHLAIEAKNGLGAAGILLNLKIEMENNKTVIITGDNQWKTAKDVESDWKTVYPQGNKWVNIMFLGEGIIGPWDFLDL